MSSVWDVIPGRHGAEIFTPVETACRLTAMLPSGIWASPVVRILLLASKSGAVARQVFQKLMENLKECLPDEHERAEWILKNMLYVVCLDESAADLVRKRLYGTRNIKGNVRVVDRDDILTVFVDPRGEGLKFDVVIGNPPYQEVTQKGDHQATPLYPDFWRMAKALSPKHICMIMPSRWMKDSGAKGLKDFREEMLNDPQILELYDVEDSSYCFPGIDLKGGVCYLHWESGNTSLCKSTFRIGEQELISERALNEFDIFVRDPRALTILRKVSAKGERPLQVGATGLGTFGFNTNHPFEKYPSDDSVRLYTGHSSQAWIPRSEIKKKGRDLIDRYKVLSSNVCGEMGSWPATILSSQILIAGPPSACTHTYRILAEFQNADEAQNFANYAKSKFFRFLVYLRKPSITLKNSTFAFVPSLRMDRPWTDADLYDLYELTQAERDHIEKMIKEME